MAIKNNNNNKKKNNDYFSQSIQQYGENFLAYKNARDLEMDAIKIFRGLARGNINIDRYGCYFLDQQLMQACLTTAYSKLMLFRISFDGVSLLNDKIFASGQTPDVSVITIMDYHKKSKEAYEILYNGLLNTSNTGDINYLLCMTNLLNDYRNYI